jgi:hypothetical protein
LSEEAKVFDIAVKQSHFFRYHRQYLWFYRQLKALLKQRGMSGSNDPLVFDFVGLGLYQEPLTILTLIRSAYQSEGLILKDIPIEINLFDKDGSIAGLFEQGNLVYSPAKILRDLQVFMNGVKESLVAERRPLLDDWPIIERNFNALFTAVTGPDARIPMVKVSTDSDWGDWLALLKFQGNYENSEAGHHVRFAFMNNLFIHLNSDEQKAIIKTAENRLHKDGIFFETNVVGADFEVLQLPEFRMIAESDIGAYGLAQRPADQAMQAMPSISPKDHAMIDLTLPGGLTTEVIKERIRNLEGFIGNQYKRDIVRINLSSFGLYASQQAEAAENRKLIAAIREGHPIFIDMTGFSYFDDPSDRENEFYSFLFAALNLGTTVETIHAKKLIDNGIVFREIFKNAFYHGNAMEFHLPIYFWVNPESSQTEIVMYDLRMGRPVDNSLRKFAESGHRLTGAKGGIKLIQDEGWAYEKPGIIRNEQGQIIGTVVAIRKNRAMMVRNGVIDLIPAEKIGDSTQLAEGDRAMNTQRKIIFKVLDIDDKEIIETGSRQNAILSRWMGRNELLPSQYGKDSKRLMDLIKGLHGTQLSIVVTELLKNAIYRQPNAEKVFVMMKTFYNPLGQRIFKMTIYQKHLTEPQWEILRANAQLGPSFPGDVRVKRKLYENAGMGLGHFMTNFVNYVPALLVYEKDTKGVMTTTFWAKVDSALVAKNGGIDLTPAKMNVEVKKEIASSLGNTPRNDTGVEGIKFHLDPAMLAQLCNAPGFVPVIISVQPMTDLRRFLEVQ